MRNDGSTSGVSWPRIGVAVLILWWTVHSAFRGSWVFIDFANLAFHEAGHLFFSFLGSTMHYLGGTLDQLLVPGLLIYHFLARQQQPIGAAFCVWWVGQSLVNISFSMANARELALPLVGGGDYDWNELFFRFGMLGESSVESISGATRFAGIAVMLVGLAWAVVLALPEGRRRRIVATLRG